MKNLKNKLFKNRFAKLVKNQRGQGMLEYILLVVVIVGLVLFLKEPLKTRVEEINNKLGSSIDGVINQDSMTIEYILLMVVVFMFALKVFVSAPMTAFKESAPRLGARVEKQIATGTGFKRIDWVEKR